MMNCFHLSYQRLLMNDWLSDWHSFLWQFSTSALYAAINISLSSFAVIKFLHTVFFDRFILFTDESVLNVVRATTGFLSVGFAGTIFGRRV